MSNEAKEMEVIVEPEMSELVPEVVDIRSREPQGLEVLQNPQANFLNTMTLEKHEDKVKLYNAINNTDFALADITSPIRVTDVIAHHVTLENEDGEMVEVTRVVLIDKEGKSYGCVSEGVLSSLQKLFVIFGRPTWKDGLVILPKLVKTNKGYKTMTLLVQA